MGKGKWALKTKDSGAALQMRRHDGKHKVVEENQILSVVCSVYHPKVQVVENWETEWPVESRLERLDPALLQARKRAVFRSAGRKSPNSPTSSNATCRRYT